MKIVRPSASHEWFYCFLSHLMQSDEPEEDNDSTREGTAVHWVGENILTPYTRFSGEMKYAHDFIGKLAPNDVYIDQEMYEAARDYVTDILKYCNTGGLIRFVKVEETMNIDTIYPGMRGTPDAWVYNAEQAELVIWDLKYGHGFVDVFENPQLMIYVAGILDLLKIDGYSDQRVTVKMRISQSRSYHRDGPIREWSVKASELRPYFNKLRYAAAMAMSGTGDCVPGTHCRHCLARYKCDSLQQSIYMSIDVINGPNPTVLTGNNLALEVQLLRRMSKLIDYRLTAIEEQAEREIRSGKDLPGFAVEQQYGRTQWKKGTPIEEVAMMCDLMGVNVRRPLQLDTPNQATKAIKSHAKKLGIELDASVIKMYSETPKKGFKVVEDNGSKARLAFRKE